LSVHSELRFLTEPGTPREEFAQHRRNLAESMRQRGWTGRPLLGHLRNDGRVQAWQGMHRLAAAEDAGLTEIPMLLLSLEELKTIGFSEQELMAAPWENAERLQRLPDRSAYALVEAELAETPKRGF
jgi:hypothetical protein